MDFRKVWEPWEIQALAEKLGVATSSRTRCGRSKGFVDGDNSGSRQLRLGRPARRDASRRSWPACRMPLADACYFPGGGNCVTFVTPGGIEGIAGRWPTAR